WPGTRRGRGTRCFRLRPSGWVVHRGGLVWLVSWTVVTGSLAYNEMAVVGFAAVGLRGVLGSEWVCGRTAVAVGLVAGAATLAKLTGGVAVALPLGGLLVMRTLGEGWRRRRAGGDAAGGAEFWKKEGRRWAAVAGCVVVGGAVLLPYLARNAAWTGNPVFPFATERLGQGHWDRERAARWGRAHSPETGWGERWSGLWRQGVANAGYGAWGGASTVREARNVARFGREGGVPVLWLAAGAGGAAVLGRRVWRRRTGGVAAALAGLLAWQVGWWWVGTHLQSRFLIVAVLPLCGLAGLGLGVLAGLGRGRGGGAESPGRGDSPGGGRGLAAVGTAALAAVLTAGLWATGWSQTRSVAWVDGTRRAVPYWRLVDGLAEIGVGSLAVNQLPEGSKVMVVGDNQPLFYFEPELVYASAFDPSPLTPVLRATQDPSAVAARLREEGVTHLWLGLSEIERLHATYGFDDEVTAAAVVRIMGDWPLVRPSGTREAGSFEGTPPGVHPGVVPGVVPGAGAGEITLAQGLAAGFRGSQLVEVPPGRAGP
ncbi:MAG: hypothetical protein AAGG38_07415, partial [Planctomycetota bacterium]